MVELGPPLLSPWQETGDPTWHLDTRHSAKNMIVNSLDDFKMWGRKQTRKPPNPMASLSIPNPQHPHQSTWLPLNSAHIVNERSHVLDSSMACWMEHVSQKPILELILNKGYICKRNKYLRVVALKIEHYLLGPSVSNGWSLSGSEMGAGLEKADRVLQENHRPRRRALGQASAVWALVLLLPHPCWVTLGLSVLFCKIATITAALPTSKQIQSDCVV